MLANSRDTTWVHQELNARPDVRLFKMMLWFRDKATATHCIRVAQYSAELARRIALSEPHVEQIARAALLHDIGKIAVPDAILLKPSPLNDEETAQMQTHASIGSLLVGTQSALGDIQALVRHHHERFDGSGYPDGLRSQHIPIGSRIIAIADSFDAMTTDRPYRAAVTISAARSELLKCAGSQFDPALLADFLAIHRFQKTNTRPNRPSTISSVICAASVALH